MKKTFKAVLALGLVLALALPAAACSGGREKFMKKYAYAPQFSEATMSLSEISVESGYTFNRAISGTDLLVFTRDTADDNGNLFKVKGLNASQGYDALSVSENYGNAGNDDKIALIVKKTGADTSEERLLDAYGNSLFSAADITAMYPLEERATGTEEDRVEYRMYEVVYTSSTAESGTATFWVKSEDERPGVSVADSEVPETDPLEREDLVPADDFGLKNMYLSMGESNRIRLFDKNKKFVRSVYLPYLENMNSVIAAFDGVVIYAHEQMVGSIISSEKVDYTYREDEVKILYTLYVADLKSGKVKSSHPDYVLGEAETHFDQDGVVSGALVEVHRVDDKMIDPNPRVYQLKKNGKLGAEFPELDSADDFSVMAIRNPNGKVSAYLVENSAGSFLYSKGFKLLRDLTNTEGIYTDFSASLIFCEVDGKVGAIDYKGKTVVDFRYAATSVTLSDCVYGGAAILQDSEGGYVRVTANGATAIGQESDTYTSLGDGLFVRTTAKEAGYTHSYEWADGTVLFSYASAQETASSPFGGTSLIEKADGTRVRVFTAATEDGVKLYKAEYTYKDFSADYER